VKYFFGLHIKYFISLKIFGATFGIGGGIAAPIATPGYAPACGQGVPLTSASIYEVTGGATSSNFV